MATETAKQRFERSIERLRSLGWRIQDPQEIEHRGAGLIFSNQIDHYFDANGELRENIPFIWTLGMPSKVQTEFARENIVVRIELRSESGRGEGEVLAGRTGDSDLCRIAQSFRRLEKIGYIAEPDFSYTNSSGWQDIHERSRGDVKAIFWNSQSHTDCFDTEGTLIDDMPMQWSGDPGEILTALRETGLTVDAPENSKVAFFIGPPEEETT
ncbi:hypothetical protein [Streptomyces bacillaris]|uniref:hypothetical protein n=1 Tax=Streptomyces bacillaris TaxID=68179 RepID=UPI00380DE2B3